MSSKSDSETRVEAIHGEHLARELAAALPEMDMEAARKAILAMDGDTARRVLTILVFKKRSAQLLQNVRCS